MTTTAQYQGTAGYGAIPIPALTGQSLTLGATGTTRNKMNLPGVTIKITQANGGTIVTVSEEPLRENMVTLGEYIREELYVIPDGVEDFDRELGKIITMHRMRQEHE